MLSPFAAAAAGLAATLQSVAGVAVVYRSVAPARVLAVTAVVGSTAFSLQGDEVSESLVARDYLIAAADLAIDGYLHHPARGDTIEETEGVVTRVYEVLSPAGEPCFRWSDPHHQTLRIHTQLVATR